MAFSTFFLLPKYLELSLHATEVQLGTAGALGALAGVAAFPLVGMLNDHFGRRRFMLLGSALITLSALSMLGIDHVGSALYATRLVQGASFALLFNSASTLMSDKVAPERLGLALGVFGSSMLVTNALAPALAELLASRFDWRCVFWTASAWGALSFLLGLLVREDARTPSTSGAWASSLALVRTPRARVVVLAIAGAGAGFGTVFTFHQPYALRVGISRLSGFFVAYAASALFGRMVLLRRLDALDRRSVSALSMLVYALSVVATAALRPGLLEGIGFALGLGHGVLYPVFNALAIQGIAQGQRGSMMALYHGGFNLGTAVALVLGGKVIEAFGYPTLFVGTGALTAAAAFLLWRSPDLRDLRASHAHAPAAQPD
ncbi:MAG: transporter [Myxococcaceae bacterium]|nr:transporter [Myxococcaceae bacterium]